MVITHSKVDDRDAPPMSRLFVVCDRIHSEDDLRRGFQKYGKIEDIWVVKSKATGENKGIAYVKFSKTSEAALAQEEMDGKRLGDSDRPLKVIVASRREEGNKRDHDDRPDKYVRLFLIVPKDMTEESLKTEFDKYGAVESVQIVRDRTTNQPKGVAYVKYQRFYSAAVAFEKCPSKYKAVFASPKPSRVSSSEGSLQSSRRYDNGSSYSVASQSSSNFSSVQNTPSSPGQPSTLHVICSNAVNQDQLWRLFDLVPCLDYCQINGEDGFNCKATVVYTNKDSADYAKKKIHGLEYPPGHRLIVKFADANVNVVGGSFNKNLCSVQLPPTQPLADPKSVVAKRCFIVLSSSVPNDALKQVFCTFGNLIEVYTLANKNCGYAKYATTHSATRAIDALNGAEICGARIKVMEADEHPGSRKRMRFDS